MVHPTKAASLNGVTRKHKPIKIKKWAIYCVPVAAIVMFWGLLLLRVLTTHSSITSRLLDGRGGVSKWNAHSHIVVFGTKHIGGGMNENDAEASLSAASRKWQYDFQHLEAKEWQIETKFLTIDEQRQNLQKLSPTLVRRFDAFLKQHQPEWATFIWQWVATLQEESADLVVFVDTGSTLMISIPELLSQGLPHSIATLADTESVSPTLLITEPSARLFRHIDNLLMDIPSYDPENNLLDLSHQIHQFLVSLEGNTAPQWRQNAKSRNWMFYEEHCKHTINYCFVTNPITKQNVLLKTGNVLPRETKADERHLPSPDVGYEPVSTITVQRFTKPDDYPETPNFYNILAEYGDHCVLSNVECSNCLRMPTGSDCSKCARPCRCYCRQLCQTDVPKPKFVAQEWVIHPPPRDATERLIPRVIHQTWFEPIDEQTYPNLKRLQQSFNQSGWEYRFYTDKDIVKFLSKHFPPEVLEAYDAFLPGAFKADLFRYCVLLIHGGLYADVDILLESHLDSLIPPDLGIMIPVDIEPGEGINKSMCLWNGFMASVPGHPFLAKALELLVNQVRNRFTSIDISATFCPDPELSVLYRSDTLFASGPCLLGTAVNQVLDRPMQSSFHPGEVKVESTSAGGLIPGRVMFLKQNKNDLGAQRYTDIENDLIVFTTGFTGLEDNKVRELKLDVQHYSKTQVSTGAFGVRNVYKDRKKANENVVIKVDTATDDTTIAFGESE